MQIDLPNLDAALKFLVGGGSSVVVMGALSYLVENWPKWHDLPKWLKLLLPMLASALLAVGAQILMGYADVVAELSPWYVIIVTAVISWINSQKTYASTKVSGYGVHNPGISIVEIVEYDTDEGVQ
jgi:uncharacterized membrane protein